MRVASTQKSDGDRASVAARRRSGGRGWYVPAGSPEAMRRKRWPIILDYYVKLPFRKARHALRRLKERIAASAQ